MKSHLAVKKKLAAWLLRTRFHAGNLAAKLELAGPAGAARRPSSDSNAVTEGGVAGQSVAHHHCH